MLATAAANAFKSTKTGHISFAAQIDHALGSAVHADDWVRGLTRPAKAKAAPPPVTAAKSTKLNQRFAKMAKKASNDDRRKNGASEDGIMGGIILDTLFSVAFPGLSLCFGQFAMSAGDMVDLYDKGREAMRDPKRAQARQMASRPAPRKPGRSIFALLFG